MEGIQYFIGIDGGGTSSKGVLVSSEGKIIAEKKGGPSNKNNIGLQRTIDNLKDLILDLSSHLEEGKKPAGIGLGLSGAGRENDREKIHSMMKDLNLGEELLLVHHDAFASLMGATGGEDGVIVIAGTGSIVYGISHFFEARAGGWGYLLGDEGSGFFVGNSAIRKALAFDDGVINAEDCPGIDEMTESLYKFYQIKKMSEIIPMTYAEIDPKGFIAESCELIFKLAENKNHCAAHIIHESNSLLADQILAVFKKLRMKKKTLYHTGSLFKNPYMVNSIADVLLEKGHEVTVNERMFSSEIGMVLALFQEWNEDIKPDILEGLLE